MRIQHNMAAMNANRQLGIVVGSQAKSTEKLSSGFRINRAGDDAAGLSISEKMRNQIKGLGQASSNAQDGISLIQTAEGALSETHNMLKRMRELAVQASNGTLTAEDRTAVQNEVDELTSEIDRIGDTTEFNTMKLLNGNLAGPSGLSVGSNATTGAVVDKQTAGKSSIAAVVAAVDADFVEETLTIDGTEVKVDWSQLTSDEKSILKNADNTGADTIANQKASALIEEKINAAIDAQGGKVEHISVNMTSAAGMEIKSGTTGDNSVVNVGTAGVAKKMIGGASETAGTSTYAGTTVAANDEMYMEINGSRIKMTVATAITGGTTTMSAAATTLQTAMNAAIAVANGASGAADESDPAYIKDVAVTATEDGRFLVSSESGAVTFSNLMGTTTAEDLGLSEAQTSATANGGMTLQIGANKGQTVNFGIKDMRSSALGISGLNLGTSASAGNALDKIDKAVSSVSAQRSKLGAVQNRLEHTIANLDNTAENLQSAESSIRDVDMAKEMSEFTKNNILQQAAQSMLAQANQSTQGVLSLLG